MPKMYSASLIWHQDILSRTPDQSRINHSGRRIKKPTAPLEERKRGDIRQRSCGIEICPESYGNRHRGHQGRNQNFGRKWCRIRRIWGKDRKHYIQANRTNSSDRPREGAFTEEKAQASAGRGWAAGDLIMVNVIWLICFAPIVLSLPCP